MKTRDPLFSALIVCVLCTLCGCASVPQEPSAEIRIYKSGELLGTPYDSVGHVWVDSWRTAFFPPTYPSEDEALRSLREEAARLGANGIVNVVCLDQNLREKSAKTEPAILCYANAVRVRPRQG